MMHPFRAYLIIFIAAFVAAGCNSNSPDPIDKILVRTWKLEGTSHDMNNAGREGYLSLTDSYGTKSFEYASQSDTIPSKGSWGVTDSTLILSFDLAAAKVQIDSLLYEVNDNEPQLVVLSQGDEITRITNKGVVSYRTQKEFRISELTSRKMVCVNDGVRYSFSYSPVVMEGAISVSSIGRGLLGLLTMILILFAFSANRKKIEWKLVVIGLSLQIIFAIGVLKVGMVKNVFELFGNFFVVILSFTQDGSRFVFGDLVDTGGNLGFIFAFQILPTIIFFSALTSLLFYLGILQKIVYVLAWIMSKTMKLSGAESLAAAANIFLGQTEAPLMVKPYIGIMTRSELMCLMTGGMATIAGGVMAAYIGFLGGDDPALRLFFAKHLLAASVMSAPAAIVAAKILIPQDQPIEKKLVIPKEKIGKNMLEALSIGTGEGLRLAVNVGAMLLVFIALIALANYFLRDFIGNMTGLNEKIEAFSNGRYDGLTMQFMLGYLCAPLSWLMGVCKQDMVLVGQLLGEKTILNEFVAYTTLGNMKSNGLFTEQKSIIIATYILCGFANFASIGIQIGGIGALAPNKRTALSELGFRALLGGTIASLLTAIIVGMLI